MRNQPNSSESTIIIEPGSRFLKIGRASDANPKRLPHCIARKLKANFNCSDPLIRGGQLNTNEIKTPDPSCNSILENVFAVQSSLEVPPNFSIMSSQSTNDEHKVESEVFNFLETNGGNSSMFALDEALERAGNPDFLFRWPLKHGFLNDEANYSAVIQDLEDIWATALDKHVGVPRTSVPSYRAILVIGDVFRRNEVRHLVDLLLTRLRFGRVFVHQVGVCATYSVGLPTACVIDLGEEKTTVCCVEDGVSHPDSRVTIAVGQANVLRMFHAMVFLRHQERWTEFISSQSFPKVASFDYHHRTDVQALRDLLTVMNKSTFDLLSQNALNTQVTKSLDSTSSPDVNSQTPQFVSAPLRWFGESNITCSVSVSPDLLLYCNLFPFVHIPATAVPINSRTEWCHEFQATSLEFSQPDDPFDELYITMTARERRKRQPGAGSAKTETNSGNLEAGAAPTEPERAETEAQENPPAADLVFPSDRKPNKPFESLVDAVLWSINQCTSTATTTVVSGVTNASGTETAVNAGLQSTVPSLIHTVADELRRRLFNCILLVGAGACGLTGHCLQKWLHAELATRVLPIGLTPNQVEVVGQLDQPDSVWIGARLVLTTDLLTDLWITGSEWKRFGTRALREKAPFLW